MKCNRFYSEKFAKQDVNHWNDLATSFYRLPWYKYIVTKLMLAQTVNSDAK